MIDYVDFCHVHGVHEPTLPGDYRACFECGHVWRTEQDFEADCVVLFTELKSPIDLNPPFCPLCSHDWC